MKRIAFVLIIAFVFAASAFGQSFTVQSVTGSAQRESGNTKINLKKGDILTAATVIHTSAGATVVLKQGSNTFTITASKSGKISELTAAPASGVRIGGNIKNVDTGALSKTTGQTSTASARANISVKPPDAASDEEEKPEEEAAKE